MKVCIFCDNVSCHCLIKTVNIDIQQNSSFVETNLYIIIYIIKLLLKQPMLIFEN